MIRSQHLGLYATCFEGIAQFVHAPTVGAGADEKEEIAVLALRNPSDPAEATGALVSSGVTQRRRGV